MRHSLWALAVTAFALGCNESSSQPSGSPGEFDFSELIVRDSDVPAAVATLGPVSVTSIEGKYCLSPGELPVDTDSTLVSRVFQSPQPFPRNGAEHLFVTSTLHSGLERAHGQFACGTSRATQGDTARLLGHEWDLLDYETLSEPAVGDERHIVHYVAVNAEGLVFLESYSAFFRRGDVTAVVNLRSPAGNVTEEDFVDIVLAHDTRIREGMSAFH